MTHQVLCLTNTYPQHLQSLFQVYVFTLLAVDGCGCVSDIQPSQLQQLSNI